MKQNIVLIGMPGAGKSTVGVVLAKKLGMDFIDTDLVIQKEEGRRLSEIIDSEGTDGFIETEERILSGITCENTVISTGGSAVYGPKAMRHLREIGTVVYLSLSYEALTGRLRDLNGRGVVLREGQTLKDLYDERTVLYKKYADLTVREGGLSVEETLARVVEVLKETD